MRCSKCGTNNPSTNNFCAKCGNGLVKRCAKCKAENPPTSDFCGKCGAPLTNDTGAAAGSSSPPESVSGVRVVAEDASSAIDGERKTVTALFADIKGSTELMEELDPEEARAIIDPALKLMIDAAHRYDGYVVQSTGDGIFALFGAPVAHEDHPQRALYAALRMQEELKRYSAKVVADGSSPIQGRVGINTGEVVVRSITTGDGHTEYTPIGHTTNLASRMQTAAPVGSIAVSENTRRLCEGYFILKPLGATKVKGVSEPVNVYEVTGLGPLRTRLQVSRARGFSRFVGRDDDMRTLEAALEQAQAGNGQVVGIVAEAGTGKSRLCFEFLERCRARGMTIQVGRAVAHGKNIPYLPILEAFRSYFAIADSDSDRAVREKIAGRLLLTDESFRELLPVVFEFFGVTDPQRPPPRMDPEAKQRQLFAALRKEVREGGVAGQLVTMIEDLHWMDAGSEAFLEQWVEAVGGSHALLIVNFRPEYHASWASKSYYRQIPLAPLGPEAVRELLTDLLGADVSIEGLAKTIHARTGGNPFFTEEVVQSLIESGALVGMRGNYKLVRPIERLNVPATVNAILAARIDRLLEREKQIIQAAAVIGKDFSEPVLLRVLGEISRAPLSETELRASLKLLKDAEFIYELSLYPVAEYTFKHPLTQEVAMRSQLQELRRSTHTAVARATAEIYAGKLDEKAALLAHHWERAGEPWQAALSHKRAAEWAGLTNATEGLRHWERVRSLVRTLPQTSETSQLGASACLGTLGVGWRLGTPTAEAAGIFDEGRRLAEESGDLRTLAALNGVYACVLGLVDGASDEYLRYSREATQLAEQTNDQGLQLAARSFLAFACLFAGRLPGGIEACDSAFQRLPADPALGAEFTGYSPFLGILCAQAWMLSRLGRLSEATAVCERAEHLARVHGDSEVLTWLQLTRIEMDICCADGVAARGHARYALETSQKSATPQAHMAGLLALGIAHRLNLEWDESVRVLEDAVRAAVGGANRMFEGWVRAELAEALLGRGELDRAKQEAQTAVTVSQAQHSRCDEVRANLALVHVQLRCAEAPALVRAEQALVRAQELIDETGAQANQPEVHECRAHLARLRGEALAARSEIEEARRLCTEMGATGRAERLAKELQA